MADLWAGPSEIVRIRGQCDAAEIVEGKGGKQVQLTLVDVVQMNSDDSLDERETRTLYINAVAGKGAAVFAGSIRKVAGLGAKDPGLLEALEGKILDIAVAYDTFTAKDGSEQTMALYRVQAITEPGKKGKK